MLTGKRPFSARTLAGYIQKHLTTEPTPPSTHVAMIPSDLETACLRLLQKSPNDRFASANHLLQYISLSTRIIRDRKLFGRAQEMHQLQECVATLSRGQGGVVLWKDDTEWDEHDCCPGWKSCSKTLVFPTTFVTAALLSNRCTIRFKVCSMSFPTPTERASWFAKTSTETTVGKSILIESANPFGRTAMSPHR